MTLQLKQVEDETGMLLFDRRPDGMRATAAGELMLRTAYTIRDELRYAEEGIAALKDGKLGTLRLGAVSTAKYFTPRLIAAFGKDNPDIRIDLFIGNRAETIDALRRNAIDKFDLANDLVILAVSRIVERATFHEAGADDIVARLRIGLEFVEGVIGCIDQCLDEIVAGLRKGIDQRAQVPQVVMRIDDRQVRFKDCFGHGVQPLQFLSEQVEHMEHSPVDQNLPPEPAA